MSDGCPIRECDDQREERFSVKKSPPLNGADRFCSSCRSRPFNDPSRSTISNTQSPENCCLHLIPPYVYCISNEAYFSCRNICEAFFSIFFFWVWFLFFLSPCCGCIYRDEGNELSCAVSPSVAAGWPRHKRADGSASGHTISPHFALLRGYDPIKKKRKSPKLSKYRSLILSMAMPLFFWFFGLRIEYSCELALRNIEKYRAALFQLSK